MAILEIASHLSATLFNVSEAMVGTDKHTLISRNNSIWQTFYIQYLPPCRRATETPLPYSPLRQSPQNHRRVLVEFCC